MKNMIFLTPVVFSDESEKFIRKYDGVSNDIWKGKGKEITKIREELREHYIPQQVGCCSYCRIDNPQSHGLTWDVEHIIPQGDFPQFLFEPRNLSLSCKDCNGSKNSKPVLDTSKIDVSVNYPSDGVFFYIIHPHFDNYEEHIKIEKLGKRIIYHPSEGKGMYTYEICNLSRFATYEAHNITDANVASSVMKLLLELNERGKINIPKKYVQIVGDHITSHSIAIDVNTAFKKQE
ncbi:HNH endonuclease [Klebsiella quasipneumoniae]|uniref:HNH endonuclease n=1 Tax=Klebsiella quasipneumoniae TaxID=1463165 RepID=UPI00214F399C|nr:HNH endonuclease [Klebsiella quasipneumoniae]MCR3881035.1 HNH endonuclease [Klebsiella quasipneumoniae]